MGSARSVRALVRCATTGGQECTRPTRIVAAAARRMRRSSSCKDIIRANARLMGRPAQAALRRSPSGHRGACGVRWSQFPTLSCPLEKGRRGTSASTRRGRCRPGACTQDFFTLHLYSPGEMGDRQPHGMVSRFDFPLHPSVTAGRPVRARWRLSAGAEDGRPFSNAASPR